MTNGEIEIKHKITGKVLVKIKGKNLSWADLRWADLRGADLRGADLSGAVGTFIFNWGVKLKIVK